MVDYQELIRIFSVPRPNGSAALRQTLAAIRQWLDTRGIAHRLHTFRLYPYFQENFGLWLMAAQTLTAVGFWLRWGWPLLLIAAVGVAVMVTEAVLRFPLVARIGAGPGHNVLIEFGPENPARELVVSAHYDTKTEMLDHHRRAVFLENLPYTLLGLLILGFLGLADSLLPAAATPWKSIVYYAGLGLTVPLLVLAWGVGLNSLLGRVVAPSQGSVDNGTACVLVLALAQDLANGRIAPKHSRITLAVFTGEEVAMQGSMAYVKERDWPLPTAALNLEIMAQDGDYIIWKEEGTPIHSIPTTPALNQALARSVETITGHTLQPKDELGGTDAYRFLEAGIPATTLATYDRDLQDGALHSPSDNPDRVAMDRLDENLAVVTHFIERFDRGDLAAIPRWKR